MKYCCERFKFRHEIPSNKGLNIRVVKYDLSELFTEKNPYRFYLSSPFVKEEISKDNFLIAHCPFCGENLFAFYKDDMYINCNKESFNLF